MAVPICFHFNKNNKKKSTSVKKANKEVIVVKTDITINYYQSVADRVKDCEIPFQVATESRRPNLRKGE